MAQPDLPEVPATAEVALVAVLQVPRAVPAMVEVTRVDLRVVREALVAPVALEVAALLTVLSPAEAQVPCRVDPQESAVVLELLLMTASSKQSCS